MEKFYVVVCLLVGCEYRLPGERPVLEDFPDEVEAAIDSWTESYSYRGCDAGQVTYAMLPDHMIADLCGDVTDLGCHLRVPRPWRHVLVVRASATGEERNTITHELQHYFVECSGTGPGSDDEHTVEGVWGEGGTLERANAALGLPHD